MQGSVLQRRFLKAEILSINFVFQGFRFKTPLPEGKRSGLFIYMNSIHPRQGTEFDWIATDIDGKIALMSTAGFGSCPINESPIRVFVYEGPDDIQNKSLIRIQQF